MSHKFLFNSSFHLILIDIDHKLSEQVRVLGCPYCGGSLHRSDYPRSPFGISLEQRNHYVKRYSFCCYQCRKRTTPPSVRFFGRYRFPAPVLILISALRQSTVNKFCTRLQCLLGIRVSKRTWKRWRHWWQNSFSSTNFWKSNTGIIPVDKQQGPNPLILFSLYSGIFQSRLLSVLQFLAPLTAGVYRAV
jgi:hypothetical protein